MRVEELKAALAAKGLAIAGASRAEGLGNIRTLVLIGPDTARFWPIFEASAISNDGMPDPLDRWSRVEIDAIAAMFGAVSFFPFGGPPWQPFLAWSRIAEGARPSPIGMQVSPSRGLWMSYRGALGFNDEGLLDNFGGQPGVDDPCLGCPAPCTTACPVAAFQDGAYDVAACVDHVGGSKSASCRDGCLARRACPIGETPPLAQRQFHMAAFLRSQRGDL